MNLRLSAKDALGIYKNWATAKAHERRYYYGLWLRPFVYWFNKRISTPFNKANPLLISLPISLFVHASVLYVAIAHFNTDEPIKVKPSKTLDITLLNIKSEKKAPDKVDLIAQVNTEASGTSDEKARPMSRDEIPLDPVSAIEKEMATAQQASLQKEPIATPEIITTINKNAFEAPIFKPESHEKHEKSVVENEATTSTEVDDILAQIEKLEVEIGADQINYNKRPKIRFLDTLAAKSTEEAEYLVKWAKHIEHIGTQYFPKKAIAQKLSGLLILQVVLDHDGKVISAEIQSGSGFAVLDNGAMRIIKLAAPFPPLPKVITEKWDQLSITRTWIFRGEGSTPIYTE